MSGVALLALVVAQPSALANQPSANPSKAGSLPNVASDRGSESSDETLAKNSPTRHSTKVSGQRGKLSGPLHAIARASASSPENPDLAAAGLKTSGPGSLIERPGGRVLVKIRLAEISDAAVTSIEALDAVIVHVEQSKATITAAVKPSALSQLGKQLEVLAVSEILEPEYAATCPTGVTSEGVTQLNASLARSVHSVDGTGVIVGIISDTYDFLGGALTGVANGELPGVSNPCGHTKPVLNQSGSTTAGTDEGRAMAEIVHDIAPGAEIRFATAANGDDAAAAQIRQLAAGGAKIIVDDFLYLAEPMYQDGVIAKAIQDVQSLGVSYFSAAGNSNRRLNGNDVGSYEAQAYRPMACPTAVVGLGGYLDCHDFNPLAAQDNTFGITPSFGGGNTALGWSEPEFGIGTDLDLFLLNGSTGTIKAVSDYDNLTLQAAFEGLSVTASASEVQFVVARYAGTGTPRFKLVNRATPSAVEYPVALGTDSIGPSAYGHNITRFSSGVAAVPYNNSGAIENSSSRGPASYCWGPVTGNTPAAALSPCQTANITLAATDGGVTSFFGSFLGGQFRFYGTSASAPHAAGAAALLVQKGCATPAEVVALLKTTAVPVGSFGVNAAGSGLVNANAALNGCNARATGSFESPGEQAKIYRQTTFVLNGTDPEGAPVYYRSILCFPTVVNCTTTFDSGWSTNRTYTPPTLPLRQAGQWRAWVWDGATPSSTNLGVRDFVTIEPADGAVGIFVSPPNNAVDIAPNELFEISGNGGGSALYYRIDICFPSTLNCNETHSSGWTQNSTYRPSLPGSRSGEWKAWVWNGTSPSSTFLGVRSFTTRFVPVNQPAVGALLNPINGDTNVATDQSFSVLIDDPENRAGYVRIDVCFPSVAACGTRISSGWQQSDRIPNAVSPGSQIFSWAPDTELPSGTSGEWTAWVWDGETASSTNLGIRSLTTRPLFRGDFVRPFEGETISRTQTFLLLGGATSVFYRSMLCFPSEAQCTTRIDSGWGTDPAWAQTSLPVGPGVWMAWVWDGLAPSSTNLGSRRFTVAGNRPATGQFVSPQVGTTLATGGTLLLSGFDLDGDTPLYYRSVLCFPSVTTCTSSFDSGWSTSPSFTPVGLPPGQTGDWRGWVWDGNSASSTNLGVQRIATA